MNGDYTTGILGFAAETMVELEDRGIDVEMHASLRKDHSPRVVLKAARGGFLPANTGSPYAIGAHELIFVEDDFGIDSVQVRIEAVVIEADGLVHTNTHAGVLTIGETNAIISTWIEDVVAAETKAVVTK